MRKNLAVAWGRAVAVVAIAMTSVTVQAQAIDADKMHNDSVAVAQLILDYSAANREMRDSLSKYKNKRPEEVFGPLGKKIDAAKEKMNAGLWQFVEDYIDTNQAAGMLNLLISFNSGEIDMERAEKALAGFQNLRDHRHVAYARSIVNGQKLRMEGAQVAELELPRPDGTTMNLTDVVGHGNYVLVDFWASWCGPCCAEIPNVKAAYEKYHDKGFDVVGISFDDKREAWLGAIEKYQLPWHNMSDLKGWDCAANKVYGVRAIPLTILYGPDGRVVATKLRGEELLNFLGKIYD